jgi:chromosomal replication initiator protein
VESDSRGRRKAFVWDVYELWKTCSKLLRDQVSDATWMACFDSVTATEVDDTCLVLTTPSSQVRDKLERSYRAMIEAVLEDVAGEPLGLTLLVRSPDPARDPTPDGTHERNGGNGGNGTAFSPSGGPANGPEWAPPRTATNAPNENGGSRFTEGVLNPRYTFDAFVIGSSNRFAHAAARSVAETPASDYNPLFIYGDSGLGKTHLLHSIGNYVRENFPGSHVRYVSSETFMNEFVESIRNNTGLQFKRRYRACDVLLVDDIQFIENKESLQEEFFHTFNSLHEASKQIVLTSDRHPRHIATLEDRLRSRFASGVITDIQPPELETRIAILRKKAEGERPHVPDDVLEMIATHVKENIRELEGALIRVSAFASLNREPLTIELAEEVLSDVLAADQPRQITPKVILEATASTFGFTIDELCGTSRRRPLVNARQISMYVFRELTDFSYPAIAREFGGRDHTTVIHAVEKISRLMKERRQVYDQATQLIQRVKGGG